MRTLCFDGDPVLRGIAAPVLQFGADLDVLVTDLFATMYDSKGRGLAAPQVGVSLRVFVTDTDWKEAAPSPMAFVNPEIIATAPEQHCGPEACLSIPGRTFDVMRSVWVDLGWTSLAGLRQTARFHGVGAVCVCHELDHLNGILITESGTEI
ncbi:peptide deformylase [Yoonia sp.]|uniref:peptide deformylase n=1 Tax=Yoonia sp. TaxID=2212373 RepID=UPI0025DF1362|nr:peptide deformylase [Yoonia sp.]